MLKRGDWKLEYGHVDGGPPQVRLYDLAEDPGEFVNLADRPAVQARREGMIAALLREWDPVEIGAKVVRSQRERFLIEKAAGRAQF